MWEQDDAQHAGETEQEDPGADHTADVHIEPAATEPEQPSDQPPETGPSTSEQLQPNGFLTELQGIDLPTADTDTSDIDLPDLSHTGERPTLSSRSRNAWIQLGRDILK